MLSSSGLHKWSSEAAGVRIFRLTLAALSDESSQVSPLRSPVHRSCGPPHETLRVIDWIMGAMASLEHPGFPSPSPHLPIAHLTNDSNPPLEGIRIRGDCFWSKNRVLRKQI